jgi:enoyl-CoA hydratase
VTDKLLVEDRGAVRLLTLNRPDQRNCVDGGLAEALGDAIDDFAASPSARVLVLTGAGELAFCAGADLKQAPSLLGHRHLDRGGPMGFARLDPGKPTIAAINGYCFAGGGELAAWCDIRVGAENAEFGCLSRRWGVPYVDGGTQRFPRILGTGNALYMLLTGVRFDARRAYELGFLQELVPPGQALPRALELAAAIAAYPNFPGLCADRRALLAGLSLELDAALALEAELVRPALLSAEVAEGLARFASGERTTSPRPPGSGPGPRG